MQLNYGLLPKGEGLSEAIQKFLDPFCAPTILEFWAEKVGGVDQIQKFLGTFYPDFGEIQHKNCPKSAREKISKQKSVPKVRAFWKKSIIKLHFFFEKLPY
jgi:hypothetical protein